MSRMFLVDDSDPLVQYTGPWIQAFGTRDQLGNFGPPYKRTLHGINIQGSLSLQFKGDSARALASIDGYQDDSLNSAWACYLDGVKIDNRFSPVSSINNWILCETGTIQFGTHTLSVNATAKNKYDFWFDQIQYTQPATADDDLSGRTLYVGDSDPNIQYGSGWQTLTDIARMTQTDGSSMQLKFNGTSLTWYGLIPDNFATNASSATYSIDSASPTTFFLTGLSTGEISKYNQVFFTTAQLSSGQHTLQVVHLGNNQTTPLNLDYLAIEGVESSPSGSSSSTAPSSTTSGNPNNGGNAPKKGTPIGAIAGGAAGGIVGIIILTVLAIFFLRRRRRKSKFGDEMTIDGEESVIEPFTDNPSSHPYISLSTSSNVQTAPVHKPPLVSYGSSGHAGVSRSTDALGPPPSLSSPTPGTSTGGPSSSGILRHQDSGYRMSPGGTGPVELPPDYTPG